MAGIGNLLGQSPAREFRQSRLRERMRDGYTWVDLQSLNQSKVIPGYPRIVNTAWQNYDQTGNDPENPYGLIPYQAYVDEFRRWAICTKMYTGGTFGTPVSYIGTMTFEGGGNCPVIHGDEPNGISRIGPTQPWQFQFEAAGGDKTILDTAPVVYGSPVTSQDLTSATHQGTDTFYPQPGGPPLVVNYENASVVLSAEVPLWEHTARCCNRIRARQWWDWDVENYTPGEVFEEYDGNWIAADTADFSPSDYSGNVLEVGAFGDPVVPVSGMPYGTGAIYGIDGTVRYNNSNGGTFIGSSWWRVDLHRNYNQSLFAEREGVVAVRRRFRTRGIQRSYWMGYCMLVRYAGLTTDTLPEGRIGGSFDGYLPVVHNGSVWTLGVLKYKDGTTSSSGVEIDFPSPDISKQNSIAEIQSPAYAPVECDGENEEITLWLDEYQSNGVLEPTYVGKVARTFLLPKSFAVSAMTFAIMDQSVSDWVSRTKVPVIELAAGDIEDITADDAWISADDENTTTDET